MVFQVWRFDEDISRHNFIFIEAKRQDTGAPAGNAYPGIGSRARYKGEKTSPNVERIDIHGYAKRLLLALRLVRDSDIDVRDKGLILGLSNLLRSQQLSLGRVAKYVYHLKVVSLRLEELS